MPFLAACSLPPSARPAGRARPSTAARPFDAQLGGHLHVGAQHGRHRHLRARHHVLEALAVQVVAGGGPDHHVLAQPFRDGRGGGRQRGTERREHQVHFFIDNQAFVDARHHLLVAAVVQLDQFDGVFLALDLDAATAVDVVDPKLDAAHAGLRGEREAAGGRYRHADAQLVGSLGGAEGRRQRRGGQGQRGQAVQPGFAKHGMSPIVINMRSRTWSWGQIASGIGQFCAIREVAYNK